MWRICTIVGLFGFAADQYFLGGKYLVAAKEVVTHTLIGY